jgi:hypothetical protein
MRLFKETGDMTIAMLDEYIIHQEDLLKLTTRLANKEITSTDYDRLKRTLFNLFKSTIKKNYGITL